MRRYLVIDQGGHAGRAFIYDARGTVISHAESKVPTHSGTGGRVEQDAEAVLASLMGPIARVAGDRGAEIVAAGLACQRSSVVSWRRDTGEPLTPVLSWQDTRGEALFDEAGLDPAMIAGITGLLPVPHYGATKLAWCLRHIPEVRQAHDDGALCWGPLASFLLFRLLEEHPYVANHTIAQRTLLFDVHERGWSQPLLDAFGIARESLPAPAPDCSSHGRLRIGDALVPMKVCAGDQNAVPFAYGPPDVHTACLNIGTGAFLLRPLAGGDTAPGGLLQTLLESTDAHRFAVEGTVNGAGAAFEWLSRESGGRAIPWQSFNEAMQPSAGLPFFINSVGGLGSPFWRTGIDPHFVPAAPPFLDCVYAVAESIAFLVRANHERMAPVRRVLLAGGLSRSALVCRLLAAALNVEVVRAAHADMTSRGVLALLTGKPPTAGRETSFLPEPRLVTLLDERYRQWRELLDAALS